MDSFHDTPPIAGVDAPPFDPPTSGPDPVVAAAPSAARPRQLGLGALALLVVVSIVAGALGGAILVRPRPKSPATAVAAAPAAPAPSTPSTPSTPGPATGATPDSIAAAVDDAVVDITTTVAGGHAAGTGMVLTPTGLVLTNNHVIAGAESISVQVGGSGPTYSADVVGYDVTDDIAVLQLRGAEGLATVTPASGLPAVGDTVVAVGNALGAPGPHAVTSGTVVALDRTISVDDDHGGVETLNGLIQTDAELQPGDSGGPLLDTSGHVIGVDTAASAHGPRFGGGVGFAIPITTAMSIADQITSHQPSANVHIGDRAILGVGLTEDTTVVGDVQSDSPADMAGITPGATITSVDGTTVASGDALRAALDRHAVGDHVVVGWTDAGGTAHTATVTLVEGPPA